MPRDVVGPRLCSASSGLLSAVLVGNWASRVLKERWLERVSHRNVLEESLEVGDWWSWGTEWVVLNSLERWLVFFKTNKKRTLCYDFSGSHPSTLYLMTIAKADCFINVRTENGCTSSN